MDALSETLRVVRLIGAIFINGRFTAPWCYQSPHADDAAPLLEPGAERVVIFHMITEGECYVEMDGQPPVHLMAGNAVIFPQGDAHRMASAPGVAAATGAKLDVVLSRRPRHLAYGGGGAVTRLVCGYLACDVRLARMLLAGLPSVVKVNVRVSNAGAWLETSLRYALSEARSPRPGGMGVLAKLSEVLFVEVLRIYMNEQTPGTTGWLAGWLVWGIASLVRHLARCTGTPPAPGLWKIWRVKRRPPGLCWLKNSSCLSGSHRCSI